MQVWMPTHVGTERAALLRQACNQAGSVILSAACVTLGVIFISVRHLMKPEPCVPCCWVWKPHDARTDFVALSDVRGTIHT